jgi:hypothetical protein
MIGINYLKRLEQLMAQAYPGSGWMDKKTSFDFLFEAAKDYAKKTRCLYSTQTITTVANQVNYALNPDFQEILPEDSDDAVKVLKYTTAAGIVSWMNQQLFSDQYYLNNTTSVVIPSDFAIIGRAAATRITGTATSTTTNSGGEVNLVDSTAPFATVSAGDEVYNSTEGYVGVVLSKTSSSSLVTAMFNMDAVNSAYAGWDATNAYVIQPAARYDLYLDGPPLTAGDTVTVSYIQRPNPVYSDFGSYNFAAGNEEALLKYAVWLYKYRDSKDRTGDALYAFYDRAVREANNSHRRATGPVKNFRVSWKK